MIGNRAIRPGDSGENLRIRSSQAVFGGAPASRRILGVSGSCPSSDRARLGSHSVFRGVADYWAGQGESPGSVALVDHASWADLRWCALAQGESEIRSRLRRTSLPGSRGRCRIQGSRREVRKASWPGSTGRSGVERCAPCCLRPSRRPALVDRGELAGPVADHDLAHDWRVAMDLDADIRDPHRAPVLEREAGIVGIVRRRLKSPLRKMGDRWRLRSPGDASRTSP